jgi:hypothetical protein
MDSPDSFSLIIEAAGMETRRSGSSSVLESLELYGFFMTFLRAGAV